MERDFNTGSERASNPTGQSPPVLPAVNRRKNQIQKDASVYAHEVPPDIHLQDMAGPCVVTALPADVRLGAMYAVQCPPAFDARVSIGDEGPHEPLVDVIVVQVMNHAVAEGRGEDLELLRVGDDEAFGR